MALSVHTSESGYSFPGAGGGGLAYTVVTLAAADLVQDSTPVPAISASSTYGAVSTIVVLNVDPGNIGNGVPDCPVYTFLIDAAFNYAVNSQISLRLKLTGTPADSWIIYLGIFDGTIGTARGVYGSLACNNGATGAEQMGSTTVNGNSAASIQANGGNLEVVFNFDGDSNRARGILVRSTSNTGPAYGRTNRNENPTSWAGGGLTGFFALGATGSRPAGTFTGVEIDYLVIPAKV